MGNDMESKRTSEGKELAVLCAWCGKKKEGDNTWSEITPNQKIKLERETKISHGICPDCFEKERAKI